MKFVERHPILIATTFFLLALAYYWFVFSVFSHRYRLTIEVETPNGLKSGSSVIEAWGSKHRQWLGAQLGVSAKFIGDAVFVDLGGGKNLIGLLASGPNAKGTSAPISMAMQAFGLRNCKKGPDCPLCEGSMCDWREIEWMSGRRDLPPDLVPSMATFSDPNDPKTARLVKPDEFEQVLGPGYRFKRAWIELTSAPVTRGIEEHLPWVKGFVGPLRGRGVPWDKGNPGRNLAANHFYR